jgi:hypothetical protein
MEDIANFVHIPPHETIACVFDENKEIAGAAKLHYAALKSSKNWSQIFGSSNRDWIDVHSKCVIFVNFHPLRIRRSTTQQ